MPRSSSRRAFGALAVSALAGCAGLSGDDSSNTTDQNGTDNDPLPPCEQSIESPDPYPDVSIESDPVPEDTDAAICVTPTEPFTDESPARIRFDLMNVGEAQWEHGFAFSPPFSPTAAEQSDSDAALFVLPDDREHVDGGEDFQFIPDEPTYGCWQARRGLGYNDLLRPRTLAPGETLSGGYTLLAYPETPCLEPGTYRTEQERYLNQEPWGFEITLSE